MTSLPIHQESLLVIGYGSFVIRLLPKSLFAWSKTFSDKSKACSRRLALRLHFVPKLALWAQTVEIAHLPLRQDLFAKNVLMTAQRNLCLGNSPLRPDPSLFFDMGLISLKAKELRWWQGIENRVSAVCILGLSMISLLDFSCLRGCRGKRSRTASF